MIRRRRAMRYVLAGQARSTFALAVADQDVLTSGAVRFSMLMNLGVWSLLTCPVGMGSPA